MIRREDTEGFREAESIVLDFIGSTPNASPADIARLIDDTGADLMYVARVLGIPPDVAQSAYDEAIQTAPPIKEVIDKQANATPIKPPQKPLKDVIQPPDPRDPYGDATKLFNAGKPVPEELQRMVFQKAGADGLNATKLAETLGVDRGLVEQAANNLGISQQLGADFFVQEVGPGGLPPQLPTGLGELTPEQIQQIEQQAQQQLQPAGQSDIPPVPATGLQIPGFDDQGNPLPGYDNQGNRLAPGENNASIPRMLGPDSIPPQYREKGLPPAPTRTADPAGGRFGPDDGAPPVVPSVQDPTGGATGISVLPDSGAAPQTPQFTQEQINTAVANLNSGAQTIEEVAAQYNVSPEFVRANLDRINRERASTAPATTAPATTAPATTNQGQPQTVPDVNDPNLRRNVQTGAMAGAQLPVGLAAAEQAATGGAGQATNLLGQTGMAAGQELTAGTLGGMGALRAGTGQARQDLMQGTLGGLNALSAGLMGARGNLMGAQGAAAQQFGAGMGDITAARDLASQQIGQAFGGAQQRFDPYSQVGQQALGQQAALSGALGQQAFQQAYQESPQMQFLREQGERAALRTAAARGGVGGGNVMKELARYSTGLASQDLQNQIQNLQALGGQGLQATGQQARLGSQAGQLQAGLQTGAASQLAAQRGQLAQSQLGTGQQLANLGVLGGTTGFQALQGQGQQLANLAQQLGVSESNLLSGLGAGRSNIALGVGTRAADLAAQTGLNVAGMRTRAGEQLAGQFGTAASQLANLQQAQGAGTADMIANQTSYINQLQAAAAQGDAAAQTELAQLQSNINMGIGSNLAGVPAAQFAPPPNAAGSILQGAALGYQMGQDMTQVNPAPVTTSQATYPVANMTQMTGTAPGGYQAYNPFNVSLANLGG